MGNPFDIELLIVEEFLKFAEISYDKRKEWVVIEIDKVDNRINFKTFQEECYVTEYTFKPDVFVIPNIFLFVYHYREGNSLYVWDKIISSNCTLFKTYNELYELHHEEMFDDLIAFGHEVRTFDLKFYENHDEIQLVDENQYYIHKCNTCDKYFIERELEDVITCRRQNCDGIAIEILEVSDLTPVYQKTLYKLWREKEQQKFYVTSEFDKLSRLLDTCLIR